MPLPAGERCQLSSGELARFWTEIARPLGAEIHATYEGPQVPSGSLAISQNQRGAGTAWYVGSFLEKPALVDFFATVTTGLGLPKAGGEGLEVIRRGDHLFVLNHGDESQGFGGTLIGPGASGHIVEGEHTQPLR